MMPENWIRIVFFFYEHIWRYLKLCEGNLPNEQYVKLRQDQLKRNILKFFCFKAGKLFLEEKEKQQNKTASVYVIFL